MKPPLRPLLETWLELGRSVPWMELALDPPFNRDSFVTCQTREKLIGHLLREQHPLGRAYTLTDVCFINLGSMPGADEWLAIKGRTAVGNIPLRVWDEQGHLDRAASKRQIIGVVDVLLGCLEEECDEMGFEVWL